MCQEELEWLGFWVTREAYKPLELRIQGVLDLKPLRNKKYVQAFVGMVNFIKNHIPRRAQMLAPLTKLTRKDVVFKWGEEEQTAFDRVKATVSESMMLMYPRIDRTFDVYPDANKEQVGAFLCQDGYALGCFLQ